MHNVHQNQGDRPGSQWWSQNGTWQDGDVAVCRPNGELKLFVSKFTTQASKNGQQRPSELTPGEVFRTAVATKWLSLIACHRIDARRETDEDDPVAGR